MRVPVRHRLEHRPLRCRHWRCRAQPYLSERTPPGGRGRIWEELDLRHTAERADREPQPVECRTAADEHFPAVRMHPGAGVRGVLGVELESVLADLELPRLRVVQRRRTGGLPDEVASLPGQSSRGIVTDVLGHVSHCRVRGPDGLARAAEAKRGSHEPMRSNGPLFTGRKPLMPGTKRGFCYPNVI